MKSRKVQIAVLSLVLAWGGISGAAGAATRPAGAPRPQSAVTVWLGRMWNALVPAWAKSRGTMDPDGTVPIVPGIVVAPADPASPGDSTTRSRGTMDPDGVQSH